MMALCPSAGELERGGMETRGLARLTTSQGRELSTEAIGVGP